MGIPNLLSLLRGITVRRHLKDYKGLTIAVDAYTWLHPALYSCSYELANSIPTKKHIEYCVRRADSILQYGIKKLVLVFDGRQLPSKLKTEENREKNREESKIEAQSLMSQGLHSQAYKKFASSIDVTPQMAYEFIQAMKGRSNVECIISPYEADAQLAYLSKSGYVDIVASEDSDLLAYGCKKVIFKLFKGNEKDIGDEISLENIQNVKECQGSNWSPNMFLTACILAGCDYLPSLKKMGINTAFKTVSEQRGYSNCLQSLYKYEVPADYESKFDLAFLTFRYQFVYCPRLEKIVHLNHLDLNQLKLIYDPDSNPELNPQNFDRENYECNVLPECLIKKIISNEFSFDFLGDMDESMAIKVAKILINPETLLPYIPVEQKLQFSSAPTNSQKSSCNKNSASSCSQKNNLFLSSFPKNSASIFKQQPKTIFSETNSKFLLLENACSSSSSNSIPFHLVQSQQTAENSKQTVSLFSQQLRGDSSNKGSVNDSKFCLSEEIESTNSLKHKLSHNSNESQSESKDEFSCSTFPSSLEKNEGINNSCIESEKIKATPLSNRLAIELNFDEEEEIFGLKEFLDDIKNKENFGKLKGCKNSMNNKQKQQQGRIDDYFSEETKNVSSQNSQSRSALKSVSSAYQYNKQSSQQSQSSSQLYSNQFNKISNQNSFNLSRESTCNSISSMLARGSSQNGKQTVRKQFKPPTSSSQSSECSQNLIKSTSSGIQINRTKNELKKRVSGITEEEEDESIEKLSSQSNPEKRSFNLNRFNIEKPKSSASINQYISSTSEDDIEEDGGVSSQILKQNDSQYQIEEIVQDNSSPCNKKCSVSNILEQHPEKEFLQSFSMFFRAS